MSTDEVKAAKPATKPAKKAEPKPVKKTEKKAEKAGYGVKYLAEQLGKKANIVRISLRNKKIKKPGKSYTWATKSDADDVLKKLKAAA